MAPPRAGAAAASDRPLLLARSVPDSPPAVSFPPV